MREHALPSHVRLSSGVAGNLIGAVFNQGSTFAVNVLLANVLGVDAYGAYAILLSTMSVFALVAQAATGRTATKYIAEHRTTDPARAGRILGLLALVVVTAGAATSTALLIGAGWLARGALDAPALAAPLGMAAPGVFFTSANGFLLGALAGFEQYAALGRAGVLSGIAYVAFGAGGGAAAGLNGAVVGIVLAAALQTVLLARALWTAARLHRVSIQDTPARADIRVLWRFALPAALATFVSMAAIWAGNAWLVRQSGGYELMALFAAANSFRTMVLFLPGVLNTVTMSILNNQRGAGEARRFRNLFRANLAITTAVVGSGAALVAACGPLLLRLFGREFAAGYPVLLILMLATLPEGISVALAQVPTSRERLWLALLTVTVPCYAVLAALAWMWIPSLGAVGLACAYVAGWGVAAVMSGIIVMRIGAAPGGRVPEPES